MAGIVLAFKNYKLVQGKGFFGSLFASEWTGLDNFKFLFVRDDFMTIIGRTVGYNLIFILLQMVIPVSLAIMLSLLLYKRFSKVCQTMMFFPHFMSWVVASYFVFAFLSPENGLITRLLAKSGITYNFYGKDANAIWPWILVLLNQWKTVGYNMVVYLATKNATALYPSTMTLDVYIYNALMQTNNINMSAAASLFQSAVGFVTIVLANWIVRKFEPEHAFF